MMHHAILKVKDGDVTGSVNELLKHLLSSAGIEALLVPQAVPSKKTVFPVLISDPKKLHADVFAPVLPVSTAAMVSRMTKVQPSSKPFGVVMHPCQIRALVELAKLNQVKLDNVVIIGVDCLGTFPVNTYANFPKEKHPTLFLLESFAKKTNDSEKYLRTACAVCTDMVPSNADIVVGLYGMDIEHEILIEAHTEKGKKLLETLQLESGKDMKHRETAVKTVHEHQLKKYQTFIKEKSGLKGIALFAEFFDTCVNCHNCKTACPICYCRECLYESAVFDAEAYKFLRKAQTKGLLKMPQDTLLFHLGRMNHMVLSCVKCGLCEQACPNNILLMDVFIPAAERTQKEFSYHPGKDIAEKIPMIVYREDEYTEVGEK